MHIVLKSGTWAPYNGAAWARWPVQIDKAPDVTHIEVAAYGFHHVILVRGLDANGALLTERRLELDPFAADWLVTELDTVYGPLGVTVQLPTPPEPDED